VLPQHWQKFRKSDHQVTRRKANSYNEQPLVADSVDLRQDDPTQEEIIDLHNKEFCVDVSIYEPVVWVEEEAEECSTLFVKDCKDKSENICADVTETNCEVVPYKECTMGLEPQESTKTVLTPQLFTEKTCEQGKKVIPHIKMLPECRNVTKQNCVTLWETDDNGNQQWTGNEACEPVSWQECKLVPKEVKFIVPEINCTDGQDIWYHEPVLVTETKMTNTFTCEIKSSTDCKTQTRPDCKTITYQECREIPVKNCEQKKIHKPTQEKLHRKKCLLHDEPEQEVITPPSEEYGTPLAEPISAPQPPLSSYSTRL